MYPSLCQPMLTSKQVCSRLHISLRTLWRWVKRHWLPKPYYPSPGAPRWDAAEVAAMLLKTRTD